MHIYDICILNIMQFHEYFYNVHMNNTETNKKQKYF